MGGGAEVRGGEGGQNGSVFCPEERNDKIIVLYTPIDGWRAFCGHVISSKQRWVICKCPIAKTLPHGHEKAGK